MDVHQFTLSRGEAALIDAADWETEFLFQHQSGFERAVTPSKVPWRSSMGKWPYVRYDIQFKCKQYNVWLHRLVMQPPHDKVVDHINDNGFDNRRENLQVCTNAQNVRRARVRGGSSRFKGVYLRRSSGLWRAQIGYENGRIVIGEYETEVEAAIAYNLRAKELFGRFARLNAIPPTFTNTPAHQLHLFTTQGTA